MQRWVLVRLDSKSATQVEVGVSPLAIYRLPEDKMKVPIVNAKNK